MSQALRETGGRAAGDSDGEASGRWVRCGMSPEGVRQALVEAADYGQRVIEVIAAGEGTESMSPQPLNFIEDNGGGSPASAAAQPSEFRVLAMDGALLFRVTMQPSTRRVRLHWVEAKYGDWIAFRARAQAALEPPA